MSASARQNQGAGLIILSGPSGVGKSTVSRRLLERMRELTFSVSATTRPPRASEREGVDYHFVSRDEFEKGLRDGAFIEHAEVFGQLYGTPVAELERARRDGRRLLLEIDVQGGLQVRRNFPRALMILLVPPSIEALRQRLAWRGTEDGPALEKRFATAEWELKTARHSGAYSREVVNDDLATAVDDVEALIREHWRTQDD